MNDSVTVLPPSLEAIERETHEIGFTMGSERKTGTLLRTLAATKPNGRILELGTGTGIGTAWILDGMTPNARLDSVDTDSSVVAVAKRYLGGDRRVTFHFIDGGTFLSECHDQYDLIFADAWPGKFTHVEAALSLLRDGGLYVIDDLLPQANWPPDHPPKVTALIEALVRRQDLKTTRLAWASGILVGVKTSP